MKPKQMRTKKSTKETENFAFYGTKSQKLKNETEKNEKKREKQENFKRNRKFCVLRHKSCSRIRQKKGKNRKKEKKMQNHF